MSASWFGMGIVGLGLVLVAALAILVLLAWVFKK